MQELGDFLRQVLQDPGQNAAAIGIVLAIIVVAVLIVVLLLVALALPAARAARPVSEGAERPRRRQLPASATVALSALMVLSIASVAIVLWYHDTSTNDYCARTCHAMAVPAETWAISAHSDVPCIRCHEGRMWQSFPQGMALRINSLYLEFTHSQGRGVKVPTAICLSCHKSVLSRPVVGRNGDTFRHSDSVSSETNCSSCHGAQGHVPPKP